MEGPLTYAGLVGGISHQRGGNNVAGRAGEYDMSEFWTASDSERFLRLHELEVISKISKA